MIDIRAAILTMTCLSGCTSLSTSADRRTVDPAIATTGIPYSLPMLQYELKVTRAVAQCFEPDAAGKPQTDKPQLAFAVTVEATPKYVQGETYLVDYEALAGFTKITTVGMEFHESTGTLKAVNASAEDRSSQIIISSVKAAIGVASLVAGIPMPAPPAARNPDGTTPRSNKKMLVCAPGTQKLLDTVEERTGLLKEETKKLEGLTKKVDLMTEQVKAGALSDQDKKDLLGLIQEQRSTAKAVVALQAKLDKAQQAVTASVTVRWPRTGSEQKGVFALEGADLAKLSRLLPRAPISGSENAENECRDDLTPGSESAIIGECVSQTTAVATIVDPLVPGPSARLASNSPGTIDPSAARPGIFIRPSVRGRLLACQRKGDCTETSPTLLLRTDDAVIPQLGQLRFLPFKNEAFQNNALSVSVRADGSIEKFEYKESKARGEVLADTAANVVAQAQGLADAMRAQEKAEEAAELAELTAGRTETIASIQHEIDRLKKQSELNELTQPPSVSELAAIKAETEQANARAALLQALLAERDARAALEGGS